MSAIIDLQILVDVHPYLFILASGAALCLTVIGLRIQRKRQRQIISARIGLDGQVIYADQGKRSKAFVTKRFGIIAKPDFIVKLRSGEKAVIEYKSRESGRLYLSDTIQVKATVLAARDKHDIKKAFVMAGNKLHEIVVSQDSESLYRDIEQYADYARRAKSGEIITVYTDKPWQCKQCSVKSRCLK